MLWNWKSESLTHAYSFPFRSLSGPGWLLNANDRTFKMEAETSKTGIHSPGSRTGTSRIVEQPEEYEIFFYSPLIIMPNMAEGCNSAFIGGTLITGNPRLYRAGDDRESGPSPGNHPFGTGIWSCDTGSQLCPLVPGHFSDCLAIAAVAGRNISWNKSRENSGERSMQSLPWPLRSR